MEGSLGAPLVIGAGNYESTSSLSLQLEKKKRVLSDKNIIITIRGSKGMDCDDDDDYDDDISYPRISCGRQ